MTFNLRDYPREHGGTSQGRIAALLGLGLSPRARGNHRNVIWIRQADGTIPASTGEPRRSRATRFQGWDYPREHGGTNTKPDPTMPMMGLSPRARGNLIIFIPRGIHTRTIPASTGEPQMSGGRLPGWRDYPREHGGTPRTDFRHTSRCGLSPRARGNRVMAVPAFPDIGTIPASTGEPRQHTTGANEMTDYPREHGGTQHPAHGFIQPTGLSPRARGNLPPHQSPLAWLGTIPASTGEP